MEIRMNLKQKKLQPSPLHIDKISDTFERVGRGGERVDGIVVDLRRVNQVHLLPLVYLWHQMMETLSIRCPKRFLSGTALEGKIKQSRFYNAITGSQGASFPRKFPNDFETFRVASQPNPSFVAGIIQRTLGECMEPTDYNKELQSHYTEVISNAFDHSKDSGEVVAVAENSSAENRISVCVFDRGRGIKSSFLTNPALVSEYESLSDAEVLAQVVKHQVTCNPRTNPHPDHEGHLNGGIGLYYLAQHCLLHKNTEMIILSGKGMLRIVNGIQTIESLEHKVRGCGIYFSSPTNIEKSEAYKSLAQEFMNAHA